jgi:tetratricopeptide (TPR) repeat protein
LSRDDWFRNEVWNSEIESAFETKLRRARNKTQYLRLQAGHLTKSSPEAALALISRYFDEGGDISSASAHEVRALAYVRLGKIPEALDAYEAALRREREFPNWRTRAFIDLPKLIVDLQLTDEYPRALELLEQAKPQLVFAVDRYTWAGATGLILYEQGQTAEAQALAKEALSAATATDSGFRYHPDVGLVQSTQDVFGTRVSALANGKLGVEQKDKRKAWWRLLN